MSSKEKPCCSKSLSQDDSEIESLLNRPFIFYQHEIEYFEGSDSIPIDPFQKMIYIKCLQGNDSKKVSINESEHSADERTESDLSDSEHEVNCDTSSAESMNNDDTKGTVSEMTQTIKEDDTSKKSEDSPPERNNGDDEKKTEEVPNAHADSKKSKKRSHKKKPKDANPSGSNTSVTSSEEPQKKKRKRRQRSKAQKKTENDKDGKEKQKENTDKNTEEKKEDTKGNDSDEDLKNINHHLNAVPLFLSIRDLVQGKLYKITKFEMVNTSKGDRIRLKLTDSSFKAAFAYIHLPERMLEHIEPKLQILNKKCDTKDGLYVVFKGMKGQAFDLTFKKGKKE